MISRPIRTLRKQNGRSELPMQRKKIQLQQSRFRELNIRDIPMNCFFCFFFVVDRRKALSLIFSQNHCRRSSPSQTSNTQRAGFEPALSSGFVK